MNEEQVRQLIREELYFMNEGQNKFVFKYPIQILDGRNIQSGKTTGTQIGTESTQKFAFFGATPVTQRTFIASPSGGATVDSFARARIDDIRQLLIDLGFMAAS